MDEKVKEYVNFALKKFKVSSSNGIIDMYEKYRRWAQYQTPDYMSLYKLIKQKDSLSNKPLISVILHVKGKDKSLTTESIDSVIGQIYDNWELLIIIDNDCSKDTKNEISTYTKEDNRVKIIHTKNTSMASVNNLGLKKSKGDFVTLLSEGDLLWPQSLLEVTLILEKDKSVDFIYTDEDQIPQDRYDRVAPFFKPDWDCELLKSINYVANMSVISRDLCLEVGGWKDKFKDSANWDFIFKVTSRAKHIVHISKVLYSVRLNKKPLALNIQKDVIKNYADSKDRDSQLFNVNEQWGLTYKPNNNPLVSIVIPTKNQYKIIKQCIDSILNKTSYNNFEIILVDTGSTVKKVYGLYKNYTKKYNNIKNIEWIDSEFNYSKACNEGAKVANGDVLIMLNNDTEIIDPRWIDVLVGEVLGDDIGAVGPLLVYPDGDYIQHAGIGIGLGGYAANLMSGVSVNDKLTRTQYLMLNTRRSISAVTGACMAIKKDVFMDLGGFRESFRITYNDVDLCLRLMERGYVNIYTPHTKLKHYESLTLGVPGEDSKRDETEFTNAKRNFAKKWKKYIKHDPYINKNLDKTKAYLDLDLSK